MLVQERGLDFIPPNVSFFEDSTLVISDGHGWVLLVVSLDHFQEVTELLAEDLSKQGASVRKSQDQFEYGLHLHKELCIGSE